MRRWNPVWLTLCLIAAAQVAPGQYLETTIPISGYASGVGIWNSVNDRVYVSSTDGVTVIDCKTNQVIKQVAATYADALCYNPAEGKVYVTTDDDTMFVLDASADTLLDSMSVPDSPRGMVFNTAMNKLYLMCFNDVAGRVRVYDGTSDKLMHEIGFTADMDGSMLWDQNSNRVLCPRGSDSLYAIDCATDNVASRIATSGDFWDMCGNPANNLVYAVFGSDVYALNPTGDSVVAVIPTSNDNPAGICAAPFPNKLFFSRGEWTYVISGGTNTVTDSILVNLGIMACDMHKAKVYAAGRPPTVLDARGDSVLLSISVPPGDIASILWDTVDSRVYMVDGELDAVYVIRDTTTGIAEPAYTVGRGSCADATVFSGTLYLPRATDSSVHSILLDIGGRKVMDLAPGANDVSRLSPGVYFVRPDPSAGRKPRAVTKVVITR